MAILKNAIVNGSMRILGKLYVNDIDVGGTASFDSISASSVSTGTLSASGATTLSSTLTVSGQGIFSRTTSPALIVGGTSSQAHIEIGSSTIQGKTNASTNGNVSINSSGGIVYLSNNTSISANNGTLTAQKLIATNAVETAGDVYCETLRAKYYDLQTVFASSGGALIVAPTLIFPTQSGSTQVIVASSNNVLTLTITDSSLTSDTMCGAQWTNNSQVKVSGIFDGVQSDTMDGTISNINVNNHTLSLQVSGGNAANIVAKTYTSSQIINLNVMMYKKYDPQSSSLYRVGLLLNATSENNSSVMDIYSGTDANVVVRSGNINGLTYTQSDGTSGTLALTNGWGFYAKGNAYIEGHIVASSGMIGGWSINATKIFNGALGVDNSAYLSVTDLANGAGVSIGGSTALTTWRIAAGSKFGVTKDGDVYASNITATGGKIGGFTMGITSLTNGTLGSDNSIYLSVSDLPNTSARSIGGSDYLKTWRIAAGSKFGVTKNGDVYASNINATGVINADTGSFGGSSGFTIAAGKMYSNSKSATNSTNTGVYVGTDGIYLGAYNSTSGACPFQVTSSGALTATSATIQGTLSAGTGSKIGPWNVDSTKIYNGNTQFGTDGIKFGHTFTISSDGVLTSYQSNDGSNYVRYARLDQGSLLIAQPIGNDGISQYSISIAPTGVGVQEMMYGQYHNVMNISNDGIHIYKTDSNENSDDNEMESDCSIRYNSIYLYKYVDDESIPIFLADCDDQSVFAEKLSFGNLGSLVSDATNTGIKRNNSWSIYEDTDSCVHIPKKLVTTNYDGTNRRPTGTVTSNENCVSHFRSTSTQLQVYAAWGTWTSTASVVARNISVPSSDIRLKENIKSTTLSGLDLINKIDMYEFDWKDDKRHQKLGFVADYLEKLDPNLSIGGGEDEEGKPDYKSVNTFYLQGYEVRAIQELSSENSALKKKITELEERISRLEKR